MNISDLLKKLGLQGVNYEELNELERGTLDKWIENLSKAELNVEMVREHVSAMRAGVEAELSDHAVGDGPSVLKDAYLKARLRNYVLLEGFLTAPDKAKKALERALDRSGVERT